MLVDMVTLANLDCDKLEDVRCSNERTPIRTPPHPQWPHPHGHIHDVFAHLARSRKHADTQSGARSLAPRRHRLHARARTRTYTSVRTHTWTCTQLSFTPSSHTCAPIWFAFCSHRFSGARGVHNAKVIGSKRGMELWFGIVVNVTSRSRLLESLECGAVCEERAECEREMLQRARSDVQWLEITRGFYQSPAPAPPPPTSTLT